MDLAQVRYFVRIADDLSFSRAAEALYVTQPTISKQVALLEKELGVKLFHRSNKGVSLTHAGEAILPDFRDALAALETALQKVAKTSAEVRGKVNLGIGSMIDLNNILPDFFHIFAQAYPQVQLNIVSLPFTELQKRLAGGQLDLIFTYSLESAQGHDQGRLPVSRNHTYLYCPMEMLPKGTELSLADFCSLPFIRLRRQDMESWSPAGKGLGSLCSGTVIEVPDMETMILYLESGLGVCIMGRSYRINANAGIRSVDLTETDGFPLVGTDAIWYKSNRNPSLKLLLDEIRQYNRNTEH